MAFSPIARVLFLLSSIQLIIASPVSVSAPTVKLHYGTFSGSYSSTYNLTYYRKIPFAASTAGNNRFRAPQPPLPITNGTYNTDQAFDMCPQRTVNGSEDCLYLGVYSRPWASSQKGPKKSLRPVLLTFYGGGFIQGSASFSIPPPGFPVLNVSQQNDYVVVYSNYRTNVFGFLSGKKIAKHGDTDLNTGLLDQRAALEWIQQNIHVFGGDPRNVTIWGQSAGGGSVVAQTIATGNRGRKLFVKAMASSPYWPKTYRYDSAENEALYAAVVAGVGCAGAEDEVACLKSVDVQTLRDVSLKLTTSLQYTTSSFAWGPVIDEAFLTVPLSTAVKRKALNAELLLTSYNLHEGENFIPPGLNSVAGAGGFNSSGASFDAWLRGYLPNLRTTDLQELKTLYPAEGSAEEIVYNTTYTRAGLVYRDLQLACPAYWLSASAKKGSLIEYTISPAKHASDTIYWNQVNAVQKSDPRTYEAYAGAMASFLQTGDPNAHKVTNESVVGVPSIKSGEQFLIRSAGIATAKVNQLEKRCTFWLSVADRIPT
ncbi:carboxylesterase-like protein [Paraphaeosphaeria sporulosa]|uniref:Carboxylic ester hydrolase n=1 Tax=Paraphaeosphaeria sporulosa TaxID=1460663 RepID=A0A177CSI0_9PLEO|nr:carboxylesterase-like protein [Paraphaeosphaeria sporulosa]OAG10485.1 carboxylesteras-like protein [Paraphaeosphaeria sporulosa]